MELIHVINGSEYNNGNTDYILTVKSYSKIEIIGTYNDMKIEYVDFENIPKNLKKISKEKNFKYKENINTSLLLSLIE